MAFSPPSPDTLVEEKQSTGFKPPSPDSIVHEVFPSPYEAAEIKSPGIGKAAMGPGTEFTQAIAQGISTLPEKAGTTFEAIGRGAREEAQARSEVPGILTNLARGAVADIAAGAGGATEYAGNVPAAVAGTQLPIDTALSEASKYDAERGQFPTAATLGYTSQGVAGMAPLAAMGALPAWAQKAVGAGFTLKMISDAPGVARQIGEELGKPEEQRDTDKLAKLYSDAAQIVGFTGLAGAHFGAPPIERRLGMTPSSLADVRAATPEPTIPGSVLEVMQPPPAFPRNGEVTAPTPIQLESMRRAQVGPAIPEVPTTPAQPERAITVLDEIRSKNARTKEDIRKLFPDLTREQAADLRRQAWSEKAPAIGDEAARAERARIAGLLGEGVGTPPIERTPNAIQPESQSVLPNVRTRPEPSVQQVPTQESGGQAGARGSQEVVPKEVATAPSADEILNRESGKTGHTDIEAMSNKEASDLFTRRVPEKGPAYPPQRDSVIWGAKQAANDPALIRELEGLRNKNAKKAKEAFMQGVESGETPENKQAQLAYSGKSQWYSGALEGVRRKGGNYDEIAKQGLAKPEAQAPKPVAETALGQWPESEWSAASLAKQSPSERSQKAKYLGAKDKTGALQIGPKTLSAMAEKRITEIKAEAARKAAPLPDVLPKSEGVANAPISDLQTDIASEGERRQRNYERQLEGVISNLPPKMQQAARLHLKEAIARSFDEQRAGMGDPVKGVLDYWRKESEKAKSWPVLAPEAPAPEAPAPEAVPPAVETPAKVEDRAQAAVNAAPTKETAKQIKTRLVSEITKSISDAPTESEAVTKAIEAKGATVALNAEEYAAQRKDVMSEIPSVTIDIPGDGTFTIKNTKEALREVLKRAKVIKTKETPNFKERQPPTGKAQQAILEEAKADLPPEQPPTKGNVPQGTSGELYINPLGPLARATAADLAKLSEALGITPAAKRAARKIEQYRQAFPVIMQSRPVRHIMDQTRDAADTMANNLGRQLGNRIRTGATDLEQMAASAMIAGKFDPAEFPALIAKAMRGNHAEAEKALNYALANWTRVEPIARRGEQVFAAQLADENAHGINTVSHEGYLPGLYDEDLWMGKGRPFIIGGKRGGVGTGFKKGKTYDSPFDAIADGYVPKSLKLGDLVENRVKRGQRLINNVEWSDSLRGILDPSDGKPVVTSVEKHARPGGLPGYETVPMGYARRSIIPGMDVAVHEEYLKLFDALTGESHVQQFEISGIPVGSIALETEGAIKHGLLLADTFHASRIMQKELFLTRRIGYKKGFSLLEYTDADLGRAVASGDITPEIASWIRVNRPTADLLQKSGLNVGQVQEALYNSVVRNIPGIGRFNRWVFEKVTRGAMLESGLIEFERVKKANPMWTDQQVAVKVARDLNKTFGNLGRQGIFKSKTSQDIARLTFLAPQWVESMARSELGGIKQLTIDPLTKRTLHVGTLGVGMAQGLAAYFVATQILNIITRKHPTWENPEKGHKLDAWIPDITGKSRGYFLSPFGVVAELTHDLIKYSSQEPDVLSAAARIAKNRSSPLFRAGKILVGGEDWDKTKIQWSWNRVKKAAFALVPTPIPLQSVVRGGPPGQTQRQLTSSLGVKTEPAGSPRAETVQSGREWALNSPNAKIKANAERKAKMDFGESAYKPLRSALLRGDRDTIISEVKELVNREPTQEKRLKRFKEILTDVNPFSSNGIKPFATPSRSKEDEIAFAKSLDANGKAAYKQAVKDAVRDFRKLTEALYNKPQNPPTPPGYESFLK